jgi:ketol-acid reductoisomerase
MASRPVTRALRQSARQLAAAPAQKRTFVSALSAGAKKAAPRAAVTGQFQQTRGVKTIDFAGTKETVYGRFQLDTTSPMIADDVKQSVPTGQRKSFL